MLKQTLSDTNWTKLEINTNRKNVWIFTNNDWILMSRESDPDLAHQLEMVAETNYIYNFHRIGSPEDIYVKWVSWNEISLVYDVVAIN